MGSRPRCAYSGLSKPQKSLNIATFAPMNSDVAFSLFQNKSPKTRQFQKPKKRQTSYLKLFNVYYGSPGGTEKM